MQHARAQHVKSTPSAVLAHAKTVLLVTLLHMPMRPSLLWHSVMEVSSPSQSTPASATGRSANRTCTLHEALGSQHNGIGFA